MCEMLLKQGAEDYHSLKRYPPSALVAAVDSGRIDIVKALLRYERVVEGHRGDSMASQFAAGEGSSALHTAAGRQTSDQLKLLLSRPGVDINLKLASTGSVENVISSLSAGADINVLNNTGRTPLHWAAANGNWEVVETLLDRGAAA
ncbi:hypothetical protein ASPSYDRAFT_50994 [Aspergillus sydowii CBS 593.65]|uniref:Uncharacterized protein n=1 Tax=Aspergillus sydowii CBS 593.65 TaxID=1036612 RepID=A0A1L9T212_9EURO|nr:uncharacterized protein ASPSYDRAFT_50994 [Aspergillus sydowii CBS 593.65]OJJ53492.1 hypothetical protein ASPSYDRAFT_50994 [Aspergillus sydowii CBS 593.65]